MDKKGYIYKLENRDKARIQLNKSEFIQFVGDQFKQLTRKNLSLPIKLYHL